MFGNDGGASSDAAFDALLGMLQERAVAEVNMITERATERFTNLVACWEALEEEEPDMPEPVAFAHIMSLIAERLNINLSAHGASTVVSTMVMGAKRYHDATKGQEQSVSEREILRKAAERLKDNECSPRSVAVINNMIQEASEV